MSKSSNNVSSHKQIVKQLQDEILLRIEKLHSLGVENSSIDKLLFGTNTLENLIITHDYRIVLAESKKEIKLYPLPKTIYLFFLRHAEGVSIKEISSHKRELEYIYRCVSNRENIKHMNESIKLISDIKNNSMCEKCSRIREAFRKEMNDNRARNYYICNLKNGKRGILLNRKLIIDEPGIISAENFVEI